jgi:hypothetical protein
VTEELSKYRYHPPRLPRILDESADQDILMLWAKGRDTYAIALQLGVPEHQVEIRLHRLKDARRDGASA